MTSTIKGIETTEETVQDQSNVTPSSFLSNGQTTVNRNNSAGLTAILDDKKKSSPTATAHNIHAYLSHPLNMFQPSSNETLNSNVSTSADFGMDLRDVMKKLPNNYKVFDSAMKFSDQGEENSIIKYFDAEGNYVLPNVTTNFNLTVIKHDNSSELDINKNKNLNATFKLPNITEGITNSYSYVLKNIRLFDENIIDRLKSKSVKNSTSDQNLVQSVDKISITLSDSKNGVTVS